MLTKEDLDRITAIIDKRMTKLENHYGYILVELIGLHKEIEKIWKEIAVIKKDIRKIKGDLHVTQKFFDDEIISTARRVKILESFVIKDAGIDSREQTQRRRRIALGLRSRRA
jgi:hypothetical protein